MPLIQLVSRLTAAVLFELDQTPNSVKITLEAGVETNANLRGANLRGANLRGADLGGANLRGANLGGANLREADLGGANLGGANLRGANLWEADLWEADLGGANLRGANLGGANLRGANLRGADLREADLGGANLGGADLWEADLREADLGGANLGGANLGGANLGEANLRGADLEGAKNAGLAQAQTSIVPESGAFEGWKRCRDTNGGRMVLVHLRIPAEAQRSSATGRKCRAEYVEVLEVIGAEEGVSIHDERTIYRAGERVTCDTWDSNRWEECAGGIHFYLTRIEAEHHE